MFQPSWKKKKEKKGLHDYNDNQWILLNNIWRLSVIVIDWRHYMLILLYMLLEMNCDVVNVHKIGYDMTFTEKNLVLAFMHELRKRNTLMT